MIRPYKPEDLEVVIGIADLAWREIYRMFRATYGDELFELLVPDEISSKGKQVRGHCERHYCNKCHLKRPECICKKQ